MKYKFLKLFCIYLIPTIFLLYLLRYLFLPPNIDNVFVKINNGKSIYFLVAGDSIGAGSGSTLPNNNFANLLARHIFNTYSVTSTITNVSMGGNNSYAEYVRLSRLNDTNTSPDLVILCCGQNDDSSKTLAIYYEILIRTIKTKWPFATIFSILQSSQKGYTDKIKTIQSLADYYDVFVVDTINPFIKDGTNKYNNLTIDGTHPNDNGYAIYSSVLEKIIDTQVDELYRRQSILKALRFDDKSLPTPMNSKSLEYTNFIEISTNLFRRQGNEFSSSLNIPNDAHIGIDFHFVRGTNDFECIINGKSVFRKNFIWDYGKRRSQRHIFELGKIYTYGHVSITLKFKRADQADSFKSIILSYP